MNRDILQRRLSKLGFKTKTAVDGYIGLQTAVESLPSLIIMDINLPGIDGNEVTKRLKADEKTKHIPILALTAHARAEEREVIMKSGCDEFETKPVEFSRLVSKINTLLGIK